MLSNPKRSVVALSGKSSWYDYYAGYSTDFVRDVIEQQSIDSDSIILDPWNGSGTTTQIAEELGHRSIGFDINPVMVIVAKAKRLEPTASFGLKYKCDEIITQSKRYRKIASEDDPLSKWLLSSSVSMIRRLERAIHALLLGDESFLPVSKVRNLDFMDETMSFFYVAMFRMLRDILSVFKASNPTWIKVPAANERLKIENKQIVRIFSENVLAMLDAISNGSIITKKEDNLVMLDIANSINLPLNNNSIDMIITSPPYCTRIDYAVATRIELALLGFLDENPLRKNMIGSTLVSVETSDINDNWGNYCCQLISAIKNHPSKASSTYYYKNYVQYFDSIFRSLYELDRVLKDTGMCIIVVQDSYYKNIHVDLAKVFCEMGEAMGWLVEEKIDFEIPRTMAGINRESYKYRDLTMPMESVIFMRKQKRGKGDVHV